MRNNNAVAGAAAGIASFFLLGIPTALIPTGLFVRMIPSNILDYVFLILTSGLIGVFAFYSLQKQDMEGKSGYSAMGGIVGGVFAFGCSICNTLLVAALGTFAVLTYFEPLRPFLGVVSIGILIYAVHSARKGCMACKTKTKNKKEKVRKGN